VDVIRYAPRPEAEPPVLVILPARLLWDKGVREFVAAARLLKARGTDARFALIGMPDAENPACVPSRKLAQWQAEDVIEYWGQRDDMPAVYAQAHVVCLPSYREGVPKSLLEAASCGRPIVATDVPGCREVVADGENGFLVPPRDAEALAAAIERLIGDADLRRRMGQKGREKAVAEFSTEKVVAATLSVYRRGRT
jgi:glycosyltransferase involved in cell wall biosynthesis